jgi:hypothetical protein
MWKELIVGVGTRDCQNHPEVGIIWLFGQEGSVTVGQMNLRSADRERDTFMSTALGLAKRKHEWEGRHG